MLGTIRSNDSGCHWHLIIRDSIFFQKFQKGLILEIGLSEIIHDFKSIPPVLPFDSPFPLFVLQIELRHCGQNMEKWISSQSTWNQPLYRKIIVPPNTFHQCFGWIGILLVDHALNYKHYVSNSLNMFRKNVAPTNQFDLKINGGRRVYGAQERIRIMRKLQ